MIGPRPWPLRPPTKKRGPVVVYLVQEVRVPWAPPPPPAGRVVAVIGEGDDGA